MRTIMMIAASLLLLSGVAHGQDVAGVDPSGSVTDIAGVVQDCSVVAQTEGTGGAGGICISATQAFLDTLTGGEPAAVDQSITDLVLALAPLAQDDGTCNAMDNEVAQAIRLASARASTPEQVARLVEIAATIEEDCGAGATADIAPAGDPASPA